MRIYGTEYSYNSHPSASICVHLRPSASICGLPWGWAGFVYSSIRLFVQPRLNPLFIRVCPRRDILNTKAVVTAIDPRHCILVNTFFPRLLAPCDKTFAVISFRPRINAFAIEIAGQHPIQFAGDIRFIMNEISRLVGIVLEIEKFGLKTLHA